MSARTDFALSNPLSDPGADIKPFTTLVVQPDGNLLMSILAVDR